MLGLSKKEKLQDEAKELGVVFEEETTIVELEELIEAKKSEGGGEESKEDEESKEEDGEEKKPSRKTPPKVELPETRDERNIRMKDEAKSGSFLVYDKNGNVVRSVETEEDAEKVSEAVDGRYEEVK